MNRDGDLADGFAHAPAGDLDAEFRRALTLHRQGRHEDAESHYRAYLARRPRSAKAWTNLGAALRARGMFGPSIAAHRKALQIDPASEAARNNLANALAKDGRYAESADLRRVLWETDPKNPARLRDLCAALRGLDRHEEVVALVDAAEGELKGIEECRLQRGFSHHVLGHYAEGFADLENRYASDEVGLIEKAPWPRWQGEDVAGRSILVIPEQGFGDAVLAARFLPGLKALGAEVSLLVQRPLRRLFAELQGVDHHLDEVRKSQTFDVYTPNMSLAHFVGLRDAPPRPPRLVIPEDSRRRARAICAPHRGTFKVGVVWTGSTTYRGNHLRSTAPESFLGLATLPGVQLFSLYKGAAHDAFVKSGMAGLIIDACGSDRDFADTAAVIDEMDLMITTDTAVVHIAGALGKPVWNLLSREGYWLYGRGERTPWYPTMRLFRQKRQGDWRELFERVEVELRLHLNAGTA